MAVLMVPLSTVAPTIAHRIGYRRTVVTGTVLVAAGMALLAALADVDRGYLSVVLGLLVLAVGVGLAMSPSTTAIAASLPEDKQGVASALNDTAREMGAALGIALFGSILNAQYRANITDAAAPCPRARRTRQSRHRRRPRRRPSARTGRHRTSRSFPERLDRRHATHHVARCGHRSRHRRVHRLERDPQPAAGRTR